MGYQIHPIQTYIARDFSQCLKVMFFVICHWCELFGFNLGLQIQVRAGMNDIVYYVYSIDHWNIFPMIIFSQPPELDRELQKLLDVKGGCGAKKKFFEAPFVACQQSPHSCIYCKNRVWDVPIDDPPKS